MGFDEGLKSFRWNKMMFKPEIEFGKEFLFTYLIDSVSEFKLTTEEQEKLIQKVITPENKARVEENI